jgi:hypothetical protein
MGSAFQLVASGSFTSDGSRKDIPLRSDFDFFQVENHTQMATTQTPGRGVVFEWKRGYAENSAWMIAKEDGADTVTYEVITAGGFSRIDQSVQTLGAAVTGTAITAADPAVVTMIGHGFTTGDRVRLYNTTGMLQIAGMDFHVTVVDANSFQLTYLDASGFAAAATAVTARRRPNNPLYFPERLFITDITQAAQAVVTFSWTHGMSVGGKIRFQVTSDNGMEQINDLIGEIVAVDTTNNTVTVDIDTTTFTAFSFPTSAVAALGYTQAHIVPVGETALILSEATDNQAEIIMRLAAGADSPAGSTGDRIYWRAWKAGFVNNE